MNDKTLSGLTELATFVTTDIAGITRGRSFAASEIEDYMRKGVGWVPANLALGAARLVEMLRLPLPINAGQVRALAANASSSWRSDLAELLPGREKEFCLAYALIVGQASQPARF